eukprot:10209398-Lingulodinium_polyedra.AAC.1
MSSAASSSVNYVDTVEALLFVMADEQSSEDEPNYWPDLFASMERAKAGKGGKGSGPPKATYKAPSPAGPPWPGGK